MVEVMQGVQKRWFKYDSLGRLIRVRQPEQEVNATLNLADTFNSSGQWTAAFTYDVLGNVLTATDAKGTVITNTYDKAGRVTARTYSNEPVGVTTPAVSFYYDGKGLTAPQSPNYAKGKLTKVTSSISETQNTLFDNFGRLTESKQITDGQTYTSAYQYNLSGALVQETYPSGRVVKNEFESDGDLQRIFGKANSNKPEITYANSFAYTPDGKIEKLKLGNGLWESAKFNSRLQVTELDLGHSVNNGSLWKLSYEYGELNTNGTVDTTRNTGNIAKQTVSFDGLVHPFVQSYKYDSLYRLTEARETSNSAQTWIQQFSYDRYGNRVGTTQNVNSVNINSTPAVDVNTNRFTSSSYQYDKNGNLVIDIGQNNQSRNIIFNGDNKQTEVKDANGNSIGKYFYDGEGKRVKKITALETTVYVYASGKLVAEYSTATPPESPTINYTATDMLGSPRVITDAFGDVVSRRDFLPFGEEIFPNNQNRTEADGYSQSGDDGIRKRFTGYEKDAETGLDFAEARMYENRNGRFTAVDPLIASGKSASPQTFNRYIYVMNCPLILVDSSGLQASSPSDNQHPARQIVDVFIALRMYSVDPDSGGKGKPERAAGGTILPLPDWQGLQKIAADKNITLNIFTEDAGNATVSNLLQSLQTPDRATFFIGHSWSDGRLRPDGSIQPGNGIRIAQGEAIGTFGVTTRTTDKEGNVAGKYSEIPEIKASLFMVFACSPGRDFDDVLGPKLSPNSRVYYNTGGADGQTWVPINEAAGFVAATIYMLTNDPEQAKTRADEILKKQLFDYANGDRMQVILPKPPPPPIRKKQVGPDF